MSATNSKVSKDGVESTAQIAEALSLLDNMIRIYKGETQ